MSINKLQARWGLKIPKVGSQNSKFKGDTPRKACLPQCSKGRIFAILPNLEFLPSLASK